MKHQGNSLFATRTTHEKKTLSRRENLFSKHVTLIQDEVNSNVLKEVHKKRTWETLQQQVAWHESPYICGSQNLT